jgi:hypothetical protein
MKDQDLNLPVIKDYVPPPDRILSMDEYVEFVQFNLENTFDKESYWEWKKIMAVDVPFHIK